MKLVPYTIAKVLSLTMPKNDKSYLVIDNLIELILTFSKHTSMC